MSNLLRNGFYWSLCLLYGLILLVVLLYLRFPEEKFKQHCVSYLEQAVPGISCSISDISYGLPLAIVFSEVKFIDKVSDKKSPFHIEEIRISPKMSNLFEKYVIHAKISKGTIKTLLSFEVASKKYVFEDMEITGIQLGSVSGLEAILKRKLTGNLEITGKYSGKFGESWFRGSGKGRVTITDGSLQFLFPVLSMDALDLQKMQTEWTFDTSVVKVEKGLFTGKELQGTFDGRLQFGSSFASSRFDVKGELTPLPSLLKKSQQAQQMLRHLNKQKKGSSLPFRLDGMMVTPALHLGS